MVTLLSSRVRRSLGHFTKNLNFRAVLLVFDWLLHNLWEYFVLVFFYSLQCFSIFLPLSGPTLS